MNPNDLKTVNTSTSLQQPPVVTVVYHPKNDLNNTTEKRSRLVTGGKISVSALERVFQLRFVEECDMEGRNEIGIPFDASTGYSSDPIQLAPDGKFHLTGDSQIDASQHQPQSKFP
jgi:hypothetical protein